MVLDVYKRPYDPRNPVICMDESPKQLIAETRIPVPCSPGKPARYDYEYKRCGMCNIFLACEPLAGKRMVKITERKTGIKASQQENPTDVAVKFRKKPIQAAHHYLGISAKSSHVSKIGFHNGGGKAVGDFLTKHLDKKEND